MDAEEEEFIAPENHDPHYFTKKYDLEDIDAGQKDL